MLMNWAVFILCFLDFCMSKIEQGKKRNKRPFQINKSYLWSERIIALKINPFISNQIIQRDYLFLKLSLKSPV